MKNFLFVLSTLCLLAFGACSKSDNATTSPTPTATVNPNLAKDAERLQQATSNAAKAREQAAAAAATPSATP